ncbi:MAG: helix-turn-helix domain-containing protein [Chloroflexota bacterium]
MPYSQVAVDAARKGITERELLLEVLNTTQSKREAAERLGVAYRTLWGYIRKYNIRSVTRYEIEGEGGS